MRFERHDEDDSEIRRVRGQRGDGMVEMDDG
jgi:hypothetical protein